MAPPFPKAFTEGSRSFEPQKFFEAWNPEELIPQDNDFRNCIITSFDLPENDDYTYHAIASVKLSQVQSAIDAGGANGMHAWYREANRIPVCSPQF